MQVSDFTVIILFNAIFDPAPHAFRPLLVEQNTAGGQSGGQTATTTNIAVPVATTTAAGTSATVSGIVRIIFKLP